MDTYTIIACLCQRRREPMEPVSGMHRRYRCRFCDLEITLRANHLPDAFYESESDLWDASAYPFCHGCNKPMDGANAGYIRGRMDHVGKYYKSIGFRCRGRGHAVSGYLVEISEEAHRAIVRQSWRNLRELARQQAEEVAQDALLYSGDPLLSKIKIKVISRLSPDERELDISSLSPEEQEQCFGECRRMAYLGLFHDLDINGTRIRYRMDPLLKAEVAKAFATRADSGPGKAIN